MASADPAKPDAAPALRPIGRLNPLTGDLRRRSVVRATLPRARRAIRVPTYGGRSRPRFDDPCRAMSLGPLCIAGSSTSGSRMNSPANISGRLESSHRRLLPDRRRERGGRCGCQRCRIGRLRQCLRSDRPRFSADDEPKSLEFTRQDVPDVRPAGPRDRELPARPRGTGGESAQHPAKDGLPDRGIPDDGGRQIDLVGGLPPGRSGVEKPVPRFVYPRSPVRGDRGRGEWRLDHICDSDWFRKLSQEAARTSPEDVRQLLDVAHQNAQSHLTDGNWRIEFAGKKIYHDVGSRICDRNDPALHHYRPTPVEFDIDLAKDIAVWQSANTRVPRDLVDLLTALRSRVAATTPSP